MVYREAGHPDASTIPLLHGWPTSGRMFRDPTPSLAGRFHLIAPDYIGFDIRMHRYAAEFTDTFDNLTDHVAGRA